MASDTTSMAGTSPATSISKNISTGSIPTLTPPREQTPGKYFSWVNRNVLGLLDSWSRKALDATNPRVAQKKREFIHWLNFLEQCKQAHPDELPKELLSVDCAIGRLRGGLKVVCDDEIENVSRQRYFSGDEKQRAQAIFDWVEHADAQPAVSHATGNSDTPVAVAVAVASTVTKRQPRASATTTTSIRYPPDKHPIWGVKGIMHGVALSGRNGKTPCINDRFHNEKHSAANLGHNGLTVGAWFPTQIQALFRGAHGSSEGGIYGRKDVGAYSVIVTSTYGDVDEDDGDVLYYSGSRALENKNPNECLPRSTGTTALHVSFQNGTVVRVIRKGGKPKRETNSVLLPHCGLRYDGLYVVTWCGTKRNSHQGLFEQFKLVRVAGQTPLSELVNIPSIAQRNDFDRITDYF